MASSFAGGPASAKQCLDLLKADIEKNDLLSSRREDILTQLKVLGRDLNNVKSLYDFEGFRVLGHYAFGEFPRSTSREALRCMANTLLLIPETQNYFGELGLLPKAMQSLHFDHDEDEFLLSRVLFLMTYSKATDFEKVAEEHDLSGSMIRNIHRHAQTADKLPTDPTATAALSDTLKLLFNVTHAFPKYSAVFTPAVPDLLSILASSVIPSPPLQPPLNWKLNAIASVDFAAKSEVANKDSSLSLDLNRAIDRLIAILDKSLIVYKGTQLDTQGIPLVTVLRKINEVADNEARGRLKDSLLPRDSERNLPLGQSSTMASRLLKLTTQPGLVNLPEAVSSLLFELSDKDASSFVKNVGYGYAAGYLMTHRIPIPEDLQRPSSSRGTVPINPVTGQRLDQEAKLDVPEMTQEEKEKEAERLYVLFERLKATGVVKVQNPVHQAINEGRFEELENSD